MKTKTIICVSAVLFLSACNKTPEYDASGNFEATDVIVSAETAGKILEFDINEGDTLKIDQFVAMIDTAQLSYQRRQLLAQRTATDANRPDIAIQLASSRRELEHQLHERRRIENLLADGAATTKQLDDIDAAISIIKDRIAAQESTLRNNSASITESGTAIEAQAERIADQIADCYITSPIAGTVLTKYCEAGEYAVPGKPLFKIADLSKIYLCAYFTSEQLADIKLGQKVTVIANFGGDKLYEYPGTITWIASESEFTPKNIQTQDSRSNLVYAVKIAVQNDGRLKIGGYANVRL